MKGKRTFFSVVLFLFLLSMAAAVLFPLILTLAGSFMSESEISFHYGKLLYGDRPSSGEAAVKLIPELVTVEQYGTVLFQSPEYLLKFWNSLFYTVPITFFQVVIALFASYSFSRFPSKAKSLLLFLYTVLMLMPYQVTMVPNYIMADRFNLIDTRWSIWLPGIVAPFSVYLLTKFMRKIPMSVYEAAKVDGANEWQICTKISIPLAKSAAVSVIILVFIDYWNMVEQPVLMLSDFELHPLSVYLAKINAQEIGVAFAVAVVYMVIPILIFLYGEDYLVEGIIYSGSVKG